MSGLRKIVLHLALLTVACFSHDPLEAAERKIVRLFDTRIPMRDGVETSADIWLPATEGRHPVLLMRTPYVKSQRPPFIDLDAVIKRFTDAGYVFVFQDVRGRGDSDGEFGFYHQEAEDGYDTIEWLANQPWSNGRSCMIGVSYLGAVQWLAAKEQPEHLTCIAPTAASGQYFTEIPYSGGAWNMAWTLYWINYTSGRTDNAGLTSKLNMEEIYNHRPLLTADQMLGRKMPLYRAFLEHSTHDDYWQAIELDARDITNIDMPVLTTTGWFDGDQPGALYYWREARKHSQAMDKHFLIIGPWNHVQTFIGGAPQIGEFTTGPASVLDPWAEHLAFYDYYLKGTADSYDKARARVFVTGVNEWRNYSDYPPPGMQKKKLFLRSKGRANSLYGDGHLSWKKPGKEKIDRYTFDPKNPVPWPTGDAVDHRSIERRDDVLVYSTEVLEKPVEVIGQVEVELYAATDARDTDFVATLLDVFPDGTAARLGPATGVIRARYRHGLDKEVLVTPGSIEKYTIALHDIGHRFNKGHRIRLEVTSSAYPVYNPNQNTGNPVATDVDWNIATQTIYHERKYPSAVVLPVMTIE